MVKFSKELEAQLIPEWKDAFVNYWQLKKHVKKVKLSRKLNHVHDSNRDFGRSIVDSIRLIMNKISQTFHNANDGPEVFQVIKLMIDFYIVVQKLIGILDYKAYACNF